MCGQLNPLARDFHRLLKNVKKLTNNQVKVSDYEDDICEFTLEIKPSDGFYKKGKFEFKIEPKEYPQIPPRVQCLTDIYHPNINSEYERDVCLSLFDEWTPVNDFEDCVQGLLFLLYNPNLEDPLSPYFDPTSDEQIERFAEDVAASLEGGDVEGFYYERNIVEEVGFTEKAEENATEVDRNTATGKKIEERQAASPTTTAPPVLITSIETAHTTQTITQQAKTEELQARILTPESTTETAQRTEETQNTPQTITTNTTELAATTEKTLSSTEKTTQTVHTTAHTTCSIKTT